MIRPMSLPQITKNFGVLEYEELDGGWIKITNNFESENMIKKWLPFSKKQKYVHKKIYPALRKALHVIERMCMFNTEMEYIEEIQIFAPRHIGSNPKKRLSSHSWGIAFDINPWENQMGNKDFKIPTKIVEVFKHVGFFWGGDFKSKVDAMHFEPRNDFFDFKVKWDS